VPKLECLALEGLEAWFNSNDHLPPHFHVEKPGEWEVRVFFLQSAENMIEVKWGRELRAKEMRAITDGAATMRAELLREWSAKVAMEK